MILASFLLATLHFVPGNGTLDESTPWARLGSLRPSGSSQVELVAETLTVVVDSEETARVHATYWLENRGDTVRGKYQAPVDFVSGQFYDNPAWDQRTYQDANLSLDGSNPRPMVPGPILELATGKPPKDTVETGDTRLRRWFAAPLALPPGRHRLDLRVTTIPEMGISSIKEAESFSYHSMRRLDWDLRPAKSWGDGIVHEFVLRMDLRALEKDSIPIQYPHLAFVKEEGIRVYRAKDLDLAKTEPIATSWNPDTVRFVQKLNSLRVDKIRWKASIDLKDYPVGNLADGDFSTAWVAPHRGQKAWLEAEIPPGIQVEYFQIVGGYAKSPALWKANSRVRTILVNGLEAYTALCRETPDDSIPPRIPGELCLYKMRLSDHDQGKPPAKLRFEFPDAQPGARSEDLAISEIILYGGF